MSDIINYFIIKSGNHRNYKNSGLMQNHLFLKIRFYTSSVMSIIINYRHFIIFKLYAMSLLLEAVFICHVRAGV